MQAAFDLDDQLAIVASLSLPVCLKGLRRQRHNTIPARKHLHGLEALKPLTGRLVIPERDVGKLLVVLRPAARALPPSLVERVARHRPDGGGEIGPQTRHIHHSPSHDVISIQLPGPVGSSLSL